MCYHCGSEKRVGYLNPTLISQNTLNPVIAKKGKSKKHIEAMQKQMRENARDVAAAYIGRAMYEWRDRHCIMAPYNFE